MIHCLDFARENDNKVNPLPDTPSIIEPPFHHIILSVFSKPWHAFEGYSKNLVTEAMRHLTLKALPELSF